MGRRVMLARSSLSCFCCVLAVVLSGCTGDTGGRSYDFPVAAAGPAGAASPLVCKDDLGWTVTLTQASLHLGGVYLNQSQSVSGAQATGCLLPGTYVAQETGARDVDLLSPTPQVFPTRGHGIDQPAARVGEVWLTRGPVSDVPSSRPIQPILTVSGVATQDGAEPGGKTGTTTGATNGVPTSVSFQGQVTLESAYQTTGATAGGDPICKKRIVSLIPAPITFSDQGGLLLRIDPCLFFLGVDFTQLVPASGATSAANPDGNPGADPGGRPPVFTFSDDPAADDYALTGGYLYGNLHSTAPYTFSWSEELAP